MNLITRLAEERDLAALVALNNEVWNDSNTPQVTTWESVEEYSGLNPLGNQIVAEYDNKFCGYVSLKSPTKLDSNKHVLELVIAVNSEYRSMGVGKALLDAAAQWGRQNGKRKLSLRVLSSNTAAINFYLKCGFEIQGRLVEEFYINDQFVDDIMMFKMVN